jgi:hypothetical protein
VIYQAMSVEIDRQQSPRQLRIVPAKGKKDSIPISFG